MGREVEKGGARGLGLNGARTVPILGAIKSHVGSAALAAARAERERRLRIVVAFGL